MTIQIFVVSLLHQIKQRTKARVRSRIKKRGENKMKTTTIAKAIEIGFDYENSIFETRKELEQEVMDFLNENIEKLEQIEDECEVSGHGSSQFVNYGNFSSSGQIIDYGYDYWYSPADKKHFHSSFLLIDEETGAPYCMNLYQITGENEYNTPKEEENG